jgi:DNA repair exonuclease SbcCD nuclease subunit
MAHGSLDIGTVAEDDHVFTSQEIQNSQMDYIALGHWHDTYRCSDKGVIACYSGAPELIARDQKEPGNILLVTLTDSGELSTEQKKTGERCRDMLEIDAADVESLQQLRARILEGAQANLVRRVALKGLRSEDLYIVPEELERELAENFFDLRIKDESHLKVEQLSGAQFEDRLILSKFVSLMKEHVEASQDEDKEIAEEALQYGVALLQGKEVI